MTQWFADLPFVCGRPWGLAVGLVCVGATWWIARRSLAGQSPARRRLGTGLRITVLTLLALALADFQLALRGQGLTVLCLVDLSDSVPRATQDEVLAALEGATAGLAADEQVGLIVFGRDASVERGPSRAALRLPRVQSVIDRSGTDLSAALRLADATFTSAGALGARRVVVISDGNANRGEELLDARTLVASGTAVDVLGIDYTHDDEVLIDSVLVPPEVYLDEAYQVEGIVDSQVEARARLLLFENGALVDTREVELLPGKTRVAFTRTNRNQERYRYEMRLEVEHDQLAQNNVGFASTLIRGAARVLFIGDAASHAPLLEALVGASIACEVVSPDLVPARADDYFSYDAILLADTPAHALGIDTQRLLHGVVKNLGVGFVMIGGPDSFGAGGYGSTPIEQLLPVEMQVKQRKILPNGALVLILHTCEFQSGNLWAKRIAQSAVKVLTPQDYVGVLLFDGMGGDRWGVPFGPATDPALIQTQIAALQPADMPSFAPTMQLAAQALETAVASQKHMIIISDGDPAPPTAPTMQSLQDSRVSVSTVCINPHQAGDTGTMKRIASDTGGRYYLVQDARQLPHIFVREALEVRRNLITEEPFTPRIVSDNEVLRGVAGVGLPVLGGYVITTPRPLAEVVLASHHDDPVLALWRYGLARTAAFTSDAVGRWAAEWIGWPGYGTFWAQLVRSVSRRGVGELFQVDRVIEGDRGRVILDAIDPEGRILDGLAIEARVLDPAFDEQAVSFQQTGPGRYEASFGARRAGSYLLSLEYEGSGGLTGTHQTGLDVSYSPEYRQLRASPERLGELARMTGGRVLVEGDDLFDRTGLRAQRQRRPLFEQLVIAALLLLFVDIFLRRVMVTLAPLRRWLAFASGRRLARPVTSGSEVLGKLLERRAPQPPRSTPQQLELGEPGAPVGPGARGPETGSGPPEGAASGGASDATASDDPRSPSPDEHGQLGYTDRLLRAKREARERQERRE